MNYEDSKIRMLVIRRKLLMDYAEIKNLMRDMEKADKYVEYTVIVL